MCFRIIYALRKMKKITSYFILFVALCCSLSVSAFPGRLHIQGKLLDGNKLVNGNIPMEFRLFTSSTGGSAIYTESATVTVVDGLYEYELGQNTTASGLSKNLLGGDVWVETVVGGQTLTPRQRLNASPYAVVAYTVRTGSITASKIANNAVDSDNIQNGSIEAEDLSEGAVDSSAILDGSILAEDIAPGVLTQELLQVSPEQVYRQLADRLKPLNPPPAIPHQTLLRQTSGASYSALGTLTTTAGTGSVSGFFGEEALSELYSYCLEVEFSSSINASSLLGTTATFQHGAGTPFAGIIASMGLASVENGVRTYIVKLLPPLARLTYSTNSKVFTERTSINVIQEMLGDGGVPFSDAGLSGSYASRDVLVQYQESDFDFISRLMEEEGIWYRFSHSNGAVTMLLGDANSGFSGGQAGTYFGHLSEQSVGTQYIYTLQQGSHLGSGSAIVRSWNGLAGNSPFESTASAEGSVGVVYEFDGRQLDSTGTDDAADLEAERLDLGKSVITGTSTLRGLRPGMILDITDASAGNMGGIYRITRVRQAGITLQEGTQYVQRYGNVFTAIPLSRTFRPLRKTSRPRIEGLLSAKVVGPGGEELHVDEFGRVKVQFHWDREGNNDESSFAWIPVMQSPMPGSMAIPRIGEEVTVAFLEGDPDRPVVLGRLFNDANPPPQTLPEHKFQNQIGDGNNVVLLDNTENSEALLIQGAKDVDLSATGTLTLDGFRVTSEKALQIDEDLGTNSAPVVGRRYRDNALVAWGLVSTDGTLSSSGHFGIKSSKLESIGRYDIILDTTMSNASQLVPMAISVVSSQPNSKGAMKVLSVQQRNLNTFSVYLQNGEGNWTNGSFVFMVTGR